MAKILKLKEIHVSESPEILKAPSERGVFVGIFHEASRLGGAVALSPEEAIQSGLVRSLLSEVMRRTKSPASDLKTKIIAPEHELAQLKKSLMTLKVQVAATLASDLEKIEAYFYTDSGRIRVADRVASPSSAEKSECSLNLSSSGKKKVLIVDDSKSIRQLLTKVFSADPRLEVVASAEKPSQVEALIRQHKPDVMTLDIHMPEMNGVELLRQLMPRCPIPTVMITSIRKEESQVVLSALEAGAVDYIEKPSMEDLDRLAPGIVEKVLMAAHVQLKTKIQKPVIAPAPRRVVTNSVSKLPVDRVIAIGSSTGGTTALTDVFLQFPDQIPPVIVVQHIPAVFSQAFAQRLNELCPFDVKEAENDDQLLPNRILIAPGGKQMKVIGSRGNWRVQITDDPPVNRFKPSVDYLFFSVAERIGKAAVGVILTGMGSDGAAGLKEMRNRGCHTVGQDEATCVVYGMPKAAFECGAVEKVAPLTKVAEEIFKFVASPKDIKS